MFSSSWDPPIIPKITFDKPKLPEEGNLNHHIIKQSIDFHGKYLGKKLTESLFNHPSTCEVPNLDNEGLHVKKLQKCTPVISEDEEVNTEVIDFICEKAPCIFKKYGEKQDVGDYRLFQWRCYVALDKYNSLPPLEHFLKVGPDVCEQEFYKSVSAGDILFGKVIDHCDDTHILQIIATGGYHHRNLLGTNIKAELRWDDLELDNTLHPDQNVLLPDDTDSELGTQMLEINTLLTVEVLHTPNIIDGKIDTGKNILVGTKGVVLQNLYYRKMEIRNSQINKFILGKCDIENSTNVYPSVLKSIESKEVHSYDECLMKLKLNVNSICKSIKTMCRCLNIQDTFYNSLMNSIHNTSISYDETNSVRRVQNEEWIKEVCERKSLLENEDYLNAAKDALKHSNYNSNKKNQDIEELEKLLKSKGYVKKSVEEMPLQSGNSLLEQLIESGVVVKVVEEEGKATKYQCNVCKVFAFGPHIHTHIGSNSHNKRFKKMKSLKPDEDPTFLREDIKKALKTGLLTVDNDPNVGKGERYTCTSCEKTLNGVNSLILHMDSKKHASMVKKALEDVDPSKLNNPMLDNHPEMMPSLEQKLPTLEENIQKEKEIIPEVMPSLEQKLHTLEENIQKVKQLIQMMTQRNRSAATSQAMHTEVFVSSRNFTNITEEDLRKCFCAFGNVVSCYIPKWKDGNNRNFGFVEFENDYQAEQAAYQTEYLDIKGNTLIIDQQFDGDKYTQIFVSSRSFINITEEDLRKCFSEFGRVVACNIAKWRDGSNRNFGFVEFENYDAAVEAAKQTGILEIKRNALYIDKKSGGDKHEESRLEIEKREQEILALSEKLKTLEYQHTDYQNHIMELKESYFAKKEHENKLQALAECKKLYVAPCTGSFTDITEDDLIECFSVFGKVISCNIPKKRGSGGIQRNYGLVEFENIDAAEEAAKQTEKLAIKGNILFIDKSPGEEKINKIKKIFVACYSGNFTKITEEDLRKCFSYFGMVASCIIPKWENGSKRNFGFVEFKNSFAADNAVKQTEKLDIKGNTLAIALTKTSDPDKIRKLFVSCHSHSDSFTNITEGDLKKRFREFGRMTSCSIPKWEDGSKCNYGIVHFKHSWAADNALKQTGKFKIKGKTLAITFLKKSDAEKGRIQYPPGTPRCVIRVLSIPPLVTEADIINCISMFGRIRNVQMKLKTQEALFEMFNEEDAKAIATAYDQDKIKVHGQAIKIVYEDFPKLLEIETTRVVHLHNLNLDEDAITTNSRIVEMASPYGEVTGVKILHRQLGHGGCKALVEMIDIAAAKNFMNNFPLNQRQDQNVIVVRSSHKALNKCQQPASQGKFTTGITFDHEIKSDHQFTSQKKDLPPKKISEDDYLTIMKKEMFKSSLPHKPGASSTAFQKKDLPPKKISEDDYLINMKKEMYTSNLLHKPSASSITSQEKNIPPKKRSDEDDQSDYLLNMKKKMFESNLLNKPKDVAKTVREYHYQKENPSAGSNLAVRDYGYQKENPSSGSNFPVREFGYQKENPSAGSNVIVRDYGHQKENPSDGSNFRVREYGYQKENPSDGSNFPVREYGYQKENPSDGSNLTVRKYGYQKENPSDGSNLIHPFSPPLVHQDHSPSVVYNAPSSQVSTVPSFALQDDFRKENIAWDERNTSEYYKSPPIMLRKSDNFDAHDILPGSSKGRISESIQPEKRKQTLSTNLTHSVDFSSGTAAELDNMSSMSAEQRENWEQRFGERENRKRKHIDKKQEDANVVDFAGKPTLDCSSNNTETSYGLKRPKILLEDEEPLDKSKFNLYARGLSIDRTKQEVYDFFSVYGVITDVHLEWCTDPTFVGEQSAYIAFTKTNDVTALLNKHQNLRFKDSLISLKMNIDSSESNSSVILVGGITSVNIDTKRKLANYFKLFGAVKAVMVNSVSKNLHYAFVVFCYKNAAKKVLFKKTPCMFNKDTLKIKEAKLLQYEKNLEKSEITQQTMSVPTDKIGQLINQSVNILKDIMNETGATYEFVRNQYTSLNQTLMIHGTPEQIFSAKKLIKEKSGIQKSNKLTEHETESDPPKILILTENTFEILKNVCAKEVDLEQNICIKVFKNLSLPTLSNEVSMMLNEMTDITYVIFVSGLQDLTENVNTSKGYIHVPKENNILMNTFVEQTQTISDKLRHQFPGVKFFWTTPTPYNFEMYNRKKKPINRNDRPTIAKQMSSKNNDSLQLLPTEYWKKMQGNFHKCLIHLRRKMLESDPNNTVDFLKMYLYRDHSSKELTGEQMLLDGEIPNENWFKQVSMKLNFDGGKALRYCIRKTIHRQILWGSDSEGKSEWSHYVKDMLDKEQQERDHCHRDLKFLPLPDIEKVIRQKKM